MGGARESKGGQIQVRVLDGRAHLLLEFRDQLSHCVGDRGGGGELVPQGLDGMLQGSNFVGMGKGGEFDFLLEAECLAGCLA